MCGFVASLILNSVGEDPRNRVIRGTRLIEHRGPDDEAFYFSRDYCAGFRRLSIIDLTDAGRQPMSDRSGRFWITFNGEIYNYKEIRKELIDLGHAFKTTGDTEVLLGAYSQWGQGCLAKLNGMFAFLIWDSKEKTLFGARDRFGEKPLFYAQNKNGIAFASEIKGLVPLLDQPIAANEQILCDYLVEAKMDHSNLSFFQGVLSIPAGHQFVVSNGDLEVSQYWHLDTSERGFKGSIEDAVVQFKELFEDSIRLRMRSDVPIGTCLSGGMDSSSIVCVIAKMLQNEQFQSATRKTFTAHYPEFDESKQLDDVVRLANCESYRISPAPAGLNSLVELLWYQDEPFMSFSVLASREVMRKARQEGVKVLINGQGADEVLAGYSPYLRSYLADLMYQVRFLSLWKTSQHELQFTGRSALKSISLLAKEEFRSNLLKYSGLKAWKDSASKQADYSKTNLVSRGFVQDKFKASIRQHNHDKSHAGRLKNALMHSMFVENLPLYLRVEDRNSMSFSLESRLPFLDHRIAEFVMALPTPWLMKDSKNKWLLRESMKAVLPESVVNRRDKFGFPTPDIVWQTGKLRGEIMDLVGSTSFRERGVFDVEETRRELESIPHNITGNPKQYHKSIRRIFRVVSTELWLSELSRYERLRTDHKVWESAGLCVVNN
jgi:asparagine synthase (glutamine-hydrolysing)